MTNRLVLGTRGSPLALAQAEDVARRLRDGRPDLEIVLESIKTHGDEDYQDDLGTPLSGKALFTHRIETFLEGGRIDLAVHSLKDLPAESSSRLVVGAIPAREDPRDALVGRTAPTLEALSPTARIGTSSLRRAAQLRAALPRLDIVDLRGNVGTRLRKLDENGWDGIVVAVAGLRRLGLGHRITQTLSPSLMLPAPGQGALAVQVRRDDAATRDVVNRIEDTPTRAAVEAERALSRRLGGDCNVPIGAYATVHGSVLHLDACVVHPDGRSVVRAGRSGPATDPHVLGVALADALLAQGAREILAECAP